MVKAKKGDKVTIHYSAKLNNGEVYDSSPQQSPLCFIIGKGTIIPGLENAVVGMSPGEIKTEKIPASQAFGQRNKNLVSRVGSHLFPSDLALKVGKKYEIYHDGQKTQVTVIETTESTVTIDANHPLAGEDLIIDIHLIKID